MMVRPTLLPMFVLTLLLLPFKSKFLSGSTQLHLMVTYRKPRFTSKLEGEFVHVFGCITLFTGKPNKGLKFRRFNCFARSIIVQKCKRLVYTEDVKKASKVNEFKRLVERAELEHGKTGAAVVDDAVPDVTVNEDLANSVLRNSIERLESEIDEMVANKSRSVETSVTLDKETIREFRGITKAANHNLDNRGLKVQEEYFRNLAILRANWHKA